MSLIKPLLAFRPNKLDWIFATKTFIAGMLALYFAFALNLSYPIWAIGTVFVIANPYAGMAASKSIYRLLGTLFGAIFAVAVMPSLINMPWLLVLVLAIWVGVCLYISLIDRSPRSYVVMLAGYTAVIICFNSIYYIETVSIFDMALGRFLEISLGVVCSAVVNAIILPIHIGPVIQMRVSKTMQDTQHVFDAILSDEKHQNNYTQLLANITRDTSDIHTMAEHLDYEKSKFKGMTKPLQELLHQMTMLVANLVAMSERMKQLDQIDLNYRQYFQDFHQHINDFLQNESEVKADELLYLPEHFEQKFQQIVTQAKPEQWVILRSLKMDIRHFIQNIRAVKLIWQRMQAGDNSLPELIVPLTTAYPSLHRDYGVAVRGGLSAFLTTIVACAFWILSGWKSGFMLAEMATITACILTFLDDPVPALKLFIRASIYASFFVFIYAYGIFPHLTSFWEVMVVLAPFILFCLMLYLHPPLHGLWLPLIMSTVMGLNLQNRYSMDQVAFFDMTIATIIGPIISVFMVHVVRSMSPDMTVQRMLALHYKELRQAIHMPYGTGFRIHLRGVLDRIGVLNTKQVQSQVLKDEINNALIEASAMVDFTRLQELIDKLPPKSALKASLLELQKVLDECLAQRESDSNNRTFEAQLNQQFAQVIQNIASIEDKEIQQRIEISINNIRNSICHIPTDLALNTAHEGASYG